MDDARGWIAGLVVAVCILGLVTFGRAQRQAYWQAHKAVTHYALVTPHPIGTPMIGHQNR